MTLWFEDLTEGERFVTGARTITEDDLLDFARVSGDRNPLHIDHGHAVALGFDGRLVHGLLGLSVIIGLTDAAGWFDRSAVAMLGVENWRFRAPLLVGATVHAEMTVAAARLSSRAGIGVVDRAFRLLDTSHDPEGVLAQEGRIPFLVAKRPDPERTS